MSGPTDDSDVRARLRGALREAMKARDKAAVSALRTTLGAIDDAEAVDAAAAGLTEVDDARIAGSVGGLGAAEVARATVDDTAARAIVEREIAERRDAAADYDRLDRPEQAEALRAEAAALTRALGSA
jgi:uncharacterized protein YqeY